MPDTTVYLKNYQPPSFHIKNVSLNFDLYDDHALVTNTMILQRQRPGPLWLNGEDLELISIEMDGLALHPSAYRVDKEGLEIDGIQEEATLVIVTSIRPQENTALSGLYRSNRLFCTQCEAQGFRRMTYFLDRPDVLTTYTTRISANKKDYPVLLSNGNLIDSGTTDADRHWVIWQDPFKKPSYLFALVAGNLAVIKDTYSTTSGRVVDLRIYVEPGNEDKCHHAMVSLKNAMQWDEQVYGLEYDLAIFMIVAVSDFNMGAMENKGLNIFNSKCVLARLDTTTDDDFANVEGVVAHEYFHNWTGNRVTCRDWFQLSLKEGLTVFRDQEFSRDMNSRDVNRITDVKALRSSQFPEDAGSMAHPVRPESYQEINNFYTATIYNKGAEVIRMQHTLLGKDLYRKGMDLYFARHDGQAVTIDDFVAAMADASGRDLTQFKRWYSQAGTPTVKVKSDYSAGRLQLTMTQHCPPTADCQVKKPFHIPIRLALFSTNGQQIPLDNALLELTEAQQTFTFSELAERPVVSLLREFSAPVNLDDELTQDELSFLLRYETDGYAKWNAAQRLVLQCLHTLLQQPMSEWKIPESLVHTLMHVMLDESLDANLRAELLAPPGFEEVIAMLPEVDVTAVMNVRDYFRKQLGSALYEPAAKCYKKLWQAEDNQINGKAFGRRKLRNICLWLMMKGDEAQALAICQEQFAHAKTMSDQSAAFALLVNCSDSSSRAKAITAFYQRWKEEELVIDKWFNIQSSCELPNTLLEVRQLLQHPAYSMKNPNKVRAVVGCFAQANPRHFHAIDGSGYAFLYEMLMIIDTINPQVAARLASPFTRWQRYDKTRQGLMLHYLNELQQLNLSRDLKEVVSKSLLLKSK